MTIDKHMERLMEHPALRNLPWLTIGDVIRQALIEVARDQRILCANAITVVALTAADEIQIVRNTTPPPRRYESLTKVERQLRDMSNAAMNASIE